MKRTFLILLCVLFIHSPIHPQELTGDEIIDKVNDIMNVETSHGKMVMTIMTTSGGKRTFVYETWSKDRGEKNLVRYLEPRRVKDQATLMLNNADDIWMYFPRTQRVRKLATHAKKQKMEGSDFSYEDMGSSDSFIEDFLTKRLGDEKIEGLCCFKIELVAKPDREASYSRLVLWVVKENFVPILIDYYDEDDSNYHKKRLVASDIQVIDGIPTAMKMVMTDKNDNTSTELEILDMEYNIELSDHIFTERNLKK